MERLDGCDSLWKAWIGTYVSLRQDSMDETHFWIERLNGSALWKHWMDETWTAWNGGTCERLNGSALWKCWMDETWTAWNGGTCEKID